MELFMSFQKWSENQNFLIEIFFGSEALLAVDDFTKTSNRAGKLGKWKTKEKIFGIKNKLQSSGKV